MPQVTLSVPQEKLSLFNELLDALGIEEKTPDEQSISLRTKITGSANAFFRKYFSWEYYKNELEFE